MQQTTPLNSKKMADHVAGYHNGYRAFISSRFSSDYVTLHEHIHDCIFRSLVDGQMLSVTALMLDKVFMKENDRKALRKLHEFLWSESKIAHEQAATYLSVQCLRTALERNQIISEFNFKYKQYFNFFSSVIDCVVSQASLRHSIAWAVTRWAFSSLRAQRQAEDWNSPSAYNSIEGPNKRLELWSHVRQTKRRAWIIDSIEEIALVRGINSEDVDSEQYWMSLDIQQQGAFELEIVDCFFRKLVDLMNLPTFLLDFTDTPFLKIAVELGVNYIQAESIYPSFIKYSSTFDNNNLEHAIISAHIGESYSLTGIPFVTGPNISIEMVLEDLKSFAGIETHAILIFLSPERGYLFIYHIVNNEVVYIRPNYKICDIDVPDILNILFEHYSLDGSFYPVTICFNPDYYKHPLPVAFFGRHLKSDPLIVRIHPEILSESMDEFSIHPLHCARFGIWNHIVNHAGDLRIGNISLELEGIHETYHANLLIHYPKDLSIYPQINVFPDASMTYFTEIVVLRENSGDIEVDPIDNFSKQFLQIFTTLLSVASHQ